MRRRTLLGSGAAALSLGIAGCTGGGDGGDGGDDGGGDGDDGPRSYNVEALTPDPENREFTTELRVEWAYRGQDVLDPDEDREMTSPEESSFLVHQFRVTNVGDAATPVGREMFQSAAPSADLVFEQVAFDDPDQFPARELDPDDVANGWVVFRVPQLQDKILLALRQDFFPDRVNATFEQTDLSFTIEDDDTGTTAPGESGADDG